jgi:LPXTG-site transpeptidase (sortase) family protein
MVWINNGNITAIDVQVTDNIPVGTTYVAGSLNCSPLGGSSTRGTNASSPLNTALSSCAFDNTVNGGRGRIQWQGNIAPDTVAATDPNAENLAANEVVITFRVTVDANVNQVTNVASSRTDVDNDGDFDEEQTLGTSLINSNQVAWSRGNSVAIPDPEELPDELPKTGFAPNIATTLPEQSAEKAYLNTEVWLEIPRLGLKMPIVGVPLVDGDWDLSWLWNEAGWLEGTAFPSWQGNSVLTSHVTLPDGEKGPFASLSDLSWGDRILVHAYGTVYTYEVRQNQVVTATDASVLRHEDKPWLTLLTCETYNEVTNTYSRRVAVRAALISVAKDKLSSGKNVR